jgi:hypothetical protein
VTCSTAAMPRSIRMWFTMRDLLDHPMFV